MKSSDDQGYAAFIGIDWADRKHDVCLKAAGGEDYEHSVIALGGATCAPWQSRGTRCGMRTAGEKRLARLELVAEGPLAGPEAELAGALTWRSAARFSASAAAAG